MAEGLGLPSSGAHNTQTSNGTGNVVTFTRPSGAEGFYISCLTNGLYMTLDGSTPTASNGLQIPAAAAPVFFPMGPKQLLVASQAGAANSVVSVLWTE